MAVETVEEILRRWNKPPVDNDLAYVLGEVADREDGRETKATSNPNAHEIQDNKVQYTDDGDDDLPEVPRDDDGNPLYDDMRNDDLKAHLAARDLPVSGKHADLVARLEEDDESDDSDDDDEDDD
jgi:hypothetical protein